MKNHFWIKLLTSLPIILLCLYFLPFLGICLLILRYLLQSFKKRTVFFLLLFLGILLFLPMLIKHIFSFVPFKGDFVFWIHQTFTSSFYQIQILTYAKRLITIGVIGIILSYILEIIGIQMITKVKSYIQENEKKNQEISQKNDMEIKLKQERAKTTRYIRCPYCGADNIVSDQIGTCKYCRRKLESNQE